MSTAAAIINNFGTYDWDAHVYGVLSSASRLAVNVSNQANVIRIAYRLHKVDSELTRFFGKVDAAMQGKSHADPKAEPPTPESLRATADNLEHLYRTLDYVYESLRRVGLTNNSLTAAYLRNIHRHGESILDLADWFEVTAQADQVESIFDRAKQQKERGELVNLAEVE